MVRVLAGVKELGRAAALAQRTGCGPPSQVWERKRGRGGPEEPGWEGAQAQGWGLILGDPNWCTGTQGCPEGQAMLPPSAPYSSSSLPSGTLSPLGFS